MSYAENKIEDAIKKAADLRADGKIVELALTPQTKIDAENSRTQKGYAELIYLE